MLPRNELFKTSASARYGEQVRMCSNRRKDEGASREHYVSGESRLVYGLDLDNKKLSYRKQIAR